MRTTPGSRLLPLVLLPALAAQTFVRVRYGVVEPRGPGAPITALNAVTAQPCGTLLTARHGQPIANAAGSSLQTLAFMNPACVNRRGQIVFVASAAGLRNQDVFVDDFGPAGGSFVLFGSLSTQSLSFPPYGELLVGGAAPVVTLLGATPYPGLAGPHSARFPIPNAPGFVGLSIHYQALGFGAVPIQFTNRTTTRIE